LGTATAEKLAFILSLVPFVKQDHGIGAFPQQLENKSPRWLSTATAEKLAFILSLVPFVKQDHGIGAFPQQLENKMVGYSYSREIGFLSFPLSTSSNRTMASGHSINS
jgi:hypothetical protein